MGGGHPECKVAIVQQCVEAGEVRSSEQCVIAALEGCDGEEQLFASGVAWGAECYFQHDGAPGAGFNAWYHSFKGGVALFNSGWVYPLSADSILVYSIGTTAAVHEDAGEAVFVNYWAEHQGL